MGRAEEPEWDGHVSQGKECGLYPVTTGEALGNVNWEKILRKSWKQMEFGRIWIGGEKASLKSFFLLSKEGKSLVGDKKVIMGEFG